MFGYINKKLEHNKKTQKRLDDLANEYVKIHGYSYRKIEILDECSSLKRKFKTITILDKFILWLIDIRKR